MLELREAILSDEYRKKWNIHIGVNFYNLYRDGIKTTDTLYNKNLFRDFIPEADYNVLIKYRESYYDDSITLDFEKKSHLKSFWVVIDKNGVIKLDSDGLSAPCIFGIVCYTKEKGYFNIENNHIFSTSSVNPFYSSDYIFLNNNYDSDESKRGVLKISKKDGSFELFSTETENKKIEWQIF